MILKPGLTVLMLAMLIFGEVSQFGASVSSLQTHGLLEGVSALCHLIAFYIGWTILCQIREQVSEHEEQN